MAARFERSLAVFFAAVLATVLAGDVRAQRSDGAATVAAETPVWAVWGGSLDLAWNRHLLSDFGLSLSAPTGRVQRLAGGAERFRVREQVGLDFAVEGARFRGFVGGGVGVRGGYTLTGAGLSIPLTDFSLRARAGDPYRLDFVSADGRAWFYLDRIMYELVRHEGVLSLRSMDLRVGDALAEAIGIPDAAGMVVAEAELRSPLFRGGFGDKGSTCYDGAPRWHGLPAGKDGTYLADVFMQNFTAHYVRSTPDADGPGGDDGRVVFTPSSTLRNNRNDGSAVATIPGDPLGTSQALHAADIPWRQMFSADCPPHDNDQHPYLIWNLYRIDADGRIEQIGRSGVKHAFLTINVACDADPNDGHVLGRGCSDTYGVGNNDSQNDLGPRDELLPATGQWGRCRSIYDPNCDGSPSDFEEYSFYEHRLNAYETDVDPDVNEGAQYLFESWYIVRDDIDIYNTMQTRPVSFSWNGSFWNVGNLSPLVLGPAIDRWVAPDTAQENERSTELLLADGHARVAVRVTDLGGGQHRYDYAVMNFDYAVPDVAGAEPNLRVVSNDGFVAFRVPLPVDASVQSIDFADGDRSATNDWTAAVEAGAIVWTAPVDAALNWGTLFRFGFVSTSAPGNGEVSLDTAGGTPATAGAVSLVPSGIPAPTYAIGGDVSGLEAGQSVTIALNGGETLELTADGAFVFATELTSGVAYDVDITATAGGAVCNVARGEGTVADADVDDVGVRCGPIFADGFEEPATP